MPVTIRLLDPPLHEFLPHTDEEVDEVARSMGVDAAKLRDRADALHEFNPMLGHRGCRLAVSYPEIAEMQSARYFRSCRGSGQEDRRAGGAGSDGAAGGLEGGA
ncbi:putative PEP-binding protein [Brucella abortus]|nr:putative PEP-binding protein [Brucella abortus]